jgi:uncharacterized repeat protein (TIGR01451 family)/MYXO-CTERM domain-containing protein
VAAGQTSATIQATSAGDAYVLGAFVTSISTFKPDFSTTSKSFTDVNGGALRPNDVVEYTIVASNTGNDTALDTVLTDALPVGVTFSVGSVTVDGVAKTDAAGDDQADYDAASRTLTVRLGTGASASQGGSMLPGATTTVKFRVTVDPNASGSIANQAVITARGLKGNPSTAYPSDGNGSAPGSPPTSIDIDECEVNGDCPANRPLCLTTENPNVCVECSSDLACGAVDSGRVCDDVIHACVDGCRGTGGNGCPTALICSSTTSAIGACLGPDAGADGGAASDGAAGGGASDGAAGAGGGTGGAAGSGGSSGSGGSGGSDLDGSAGGGGTAVDGSAGGDQDGCSGCGGNAIDGSAGSGGNGVGGSAGGGGAQDASTGDGSQDASSGDGSQIDGTSSDGAGADSAADGGNTDDASAADASDGSPDGPVDGASDGSSDAHAEASSDGAVDGGLGADAHADASKSDGGAPTDVTIEGGGCACSMPGTTSRGSGPLSTLLALVALAAVRRRRERRSRILTP